VDWAGRLFDFLAAGGPVMWPLVILSLIMWGLISVKAAWLISMQRQRVSLKEAMEFLEQGRTDGPGSTSPRGRALAYFLGNRFQSGDTDRLIWEVAVRRQRPALQDHLQTVLILAAAAPLLGLLGSVSGMMETFQAISRHGSGNIQALAVGIREALFSTQAGLLVAIPGLLAGRILRRRAQGMDRDLLVFHQAIDRWLERGRNSVQA
jgi:biopolymer transport protein ExbB